MLLSSDERLQRGLLDFVLSVKLRCSLDLLHRCVDCQLCVLLWVLVLEGAVAVVVKAKPIQ